MTVVMNIFIISTFIVAVFTVYITEGCGHSSYAYCNCVLLYILLIDVNIFIIRLL